MRVSGLREGLMAVALGAGASPSHAQVPESSPARPSEAVQRSQAHMAKWPGAGEAGPPPATPHDRDALYPSPITIYGLLNAGLAQPDSLPLALAPPDTLAPTRHLRVEGIERSRVGLRATEVLGGGYRAHLHLEQSVRLDEGVALVPAAGGVSVAGTF